MDHRTSRLALMLRLSLGTAGALSLTGCASMSDVIHEHKTGGGTTVVYPVSVSEALEIARTVFQWEVGEHIEQHFDAGYLLTSTEPGAFTWGTVMGAWVEEAAEGQAKVTVVTKRRYVMSFTTDLTERTFHRRFAQAVAILESGNSLPKEPPRWFGKLEAAR